MHSVWEAPTTTARDRKELLRTLLEEVIVTLFKAEQRIRLTLRWRGGSLTDIDLDLPRRRSAVVRTDEDTIALVRRVATSTIHRLLNEGFIGGEQLTPGAPWRIRLTDDLRARFVDDAPQGYLTMHQAMCLLGVSRQTVLQRVKRGELEAIQVMRGKKKGLRIKPVRTQSMLFDLTS